jgi:leucyl/phenylalanyl-tRNA---protein transferase
MPQPTHPVQPVPSHWSLPDPANASAAAGELLGVGADLEPGTLLAAYRRGLFPMPLPEDLRQEVPDLVPIGWWCPDPRGVLPLSSLRVTRSLRRSAAKFVIRVDSAFVDVIEACADPTRPHGWIDEDIAAAYVQLHDLGWAHSVEAWDQETGELAGGLYGVTIGGLFAGESMFHRQTDASKVALVGLVHLLNQLGFVLLDVQWQTPHLQSLGVIEISRSQYLHELALAVDAPAEFLGPLDQPLHLEFGAN